MLEITAADIQSLDDKTLRELIARLCEAELRRRNLSPLFVTWGGHQDAADGGVDVRVALPDGCEISNSIPRANVGYQAKVQAMGKAEISDEMRPNGELRPAIVDLATKHGAYIIVSSKSNATDHALQVRRETMKSAIQDAPQADHLYTDFFDAQRVASWVEDHPGIVPWVREKVGRPVQGWRSHGRWAGSEGKYLFDESPRVYPGRSESGRAISALAGIKLVRELLHQPKTAARLIGLSGVGKTRFLEALFEGGIGENPLEPATALYANLEAGPQPAPLHLVTNLAARGHRAVVLVDNCPPELHRLLAGECKQNGSRVSVITVEYDIREDAPEGTEVFYLRGSSDELINQLVQTRYPWISPTVLPSIAKASGGNARIAIAICETIDRNETVAGLADVDLFRRLFRQGNEPDESLVS